MVRLKRATNLGKFLRILRITQDQSVQAMCAQLHISRTMLYNLESGACTLTNKMRQNIINSYNLSKEQIDKLNACIDQKTYRFTFRVTKLAPSDKDLLKNLTWNFHMLTDKDKRVISNLVDARAFDHSNQ